MTLLQWAGEEVKGQHQNWHSWDRPSSLSCAKPASGKFRANSAWLVCVAMAFNLDAPTLSPLRSTPERPSALSALS